MGHNCVKRKKQKEKRKYGFCDFMIMKNAVIYMNIEGVGVQEFCGGANNFKFYWAMRTTQ